MILQERSDSREWSGGSCTLRFNLIGTADDAAAKAYLMANAPTGWAGLVRESDPTLEPQTVNATADSGIWLCTVKYNKPARVVFPQETSEIGTVRIRFSTKGGTQHIVQSLKTKSVHVDNSMGTAPTFGYVGVDGGGGIGWDGEKFEGCDVPAGALAFTVTKIFAAGQQPTVADLYALTARVNNAPFNVVDTVDGTTVSLEEGECIFDGAEKGGDRADGGIELSFDFRANPNGVITVGGMTNIAVEGWDYAWPLYKSVEDATAKTMVARPWAVFVEQVLKYGNFTGLGL